MIRKVLRSTAAGALVGVVVALLLHAAILNTPMQVPPNRFGWQLFSFGLAGALAGLALSSVIGLRASNPDPEYQRRRSPRGPNQS